MTEILPLDALSAQRFWGLHLGRVQGRPRPVAGDRDSIRYFEHSGQQATVPARSDAPVVSAPKENGQAKGSTLSRCSSS